jgi:type II secretory pathway pseudopilin PulG
MLNDRGYTLTELVIVMGIFISIMIMSTYAFEHILSRSGQQAKSAESNIEGIVGLELLRSDIEHAGYGLPYSFQNWSSVRYNEVDVGDNFLADGIASNSFNSQRTSNIRAFESGISTASDTILNTSSKTNPGTGYLVIRSAIVAINGAARKWSYVNYSASGSTNVSYLKQWGNGDDLVTGDRVITISSTFSTGGTQDKRLIMSGDVFSYAVNGPQPPDDAFKPGDASQLYIVYGINSNANLKMPYNRADYYVARPGTNMPAMCNPGTGILYKATANHNNTGFTPYPLLDCVGDMQVEFELDPNNDGNTTFTGGIAALTAQQVRSQLKNVRIYILAHEGQKDRNFTYGASSIQVGDPNRPASSGRTLDSALMQTYFGTDWKNYRWKVFTLVVRPKNLN